MTPFLNSKHYPSSSASEDQALGASLNKILQNDYHGSFFTMLATYQQILADNAQRHRWPEINDKLATLFQCGTSEVINGPMIGIPVSIRDSDCFKHTTRLTGKNRSIIASMEWMATAWNASLADTGLWMGKTFEPVSRETVAEKTGNDTEMLEAYDEQSTRIGRNYFRQPSEPELLQAIALPALTELWKLRDRPMSPDTAGFDGKLLAKNLEKEQAIPYSKTGGYFLCNPGDSLLPELHGKRVYQLNYRWPELGPSYPMTRLIDELVRIDDGIYLGQLIYATRHYSLGNFTLPDGQMQSIGETYPHHSLLDKIERILPIDLPGHENYYGYQNNGYFLMVDPDFAKTFYRSFPQLRPRHGETGFQQSECDGLDTEHAAPPQQNSRPEVNNWKNSAALHAKFTTFILEDASKDADDVTDMLVNGESILQMLQRISGEVSARSDPEDTLKQFDKFNRLFRRGVAPTVENGMFQGHGKDGYNIRIESKQTHDWYGEEQRSTGFDYYHGATLNLHCGFGETFCPDPDARPDDHLLFPSTLSTLMEQHDSPNLLNIMWHNIGKYIFPWAGKSYERISGRKLSMLLDESSDLEERYPDRVTELKAHLSSAPHYALVKRNRDHPSDGLYAEHLKSGAWDKGMSDEDKAFWEHEADSHWVDGNNIQDQRIVRADVVMRTVDMNYRVPDESLQAASAAGPSPFARQGYIFLGVDDRESILPMNNAGSKKKKVFQFHYRFPMIGGPTPIGYCLDEIVEIADGLYLGQLIYSTALHQPFHSSVDPAEYHYQLFGYFLLLDDQWQQHRLDIGLDTLC